MSFATPRIMTYAHNNPPHFITVLISPLLSYLPAGAGSRMSSRLAEGENHESLCGSSHGWFSLWRSRPCRRSGRGNPRGFGIGSPDRAKLQGVGRAGPKPDPQPPT